MEGSDGLLLEIDGKIVPNYDATIHPFAEGDVVTGHVVRIDNDEVLVDIGYKSEGVIPASSSRSGNPSIRATRYRSVKKSTPLSSPRRIRTAVSSFPRSAPDSKRPGAGSSQRPSPAIRSRVR